MNKIDTFSIALGTLQTNCYFITNIQAKATAIVDPATDFPVIYDMINKNGLKPTAILLTHGHFDHTEAAAELKSTYNIPIIACADESALLADANINGSILMLGAELSISADHLVTDCETLKLADTAIKVITTPGHTRGSVCYYIEAENMLFSGDTLFRESFGRTDFPTGSPAMLAHSIKEKLFALPDETAVYPGHGAASTIKHEKKHNMIQHMDPKDI